MTTTDTPTAYAPLILRLHRLMDAFAKSDDERDFYVDRVEGFLVFVDLDKTQEELDVLEAELASYSERYLPVPKLTFYEAKKIMENFVYEKVYDIDTKEKLLDIIQSQDSRENFLEFLHDHHAELEKWQQFYQERWRIRIIEWLRKLGIRFAFEEDLTEFPRRTIETLKKTLLQQKVPKEVLAARKSLEDKAESYYSNEALNPRPKRGRPPKQVAKVEVEPQVTGDFYASVSPAMRPFLFVPDIRGLSYITFSTRFRSVKEFSLALRAGRPEATSAEREELEKKLASLRRLSAQVLTKEAGKALPMRPVAADQTAATKTLTAKRPMSANKETKRPQKEELAQEEPPQPKRRRIRRTS